jgi:hypothetical protein
MNKTGEILKTKYRLVRCVCNRGNHIVRLPDFLIL